MADNMLHQLLSLAPFSLSAQEKEKLYTKILSDRTLLHKENCPDYAKILNFFSQDTLKWGHTRELPFIPVRLFKYYVLKSIPDDEVVKIMTSSGTTGQQVSRIYLDKDSATLQSRVLSKIVADFTGALRMPFLVVDVPSLLKNRQAFSARAAGVLGFSLMGSGLTYMLNDDYTINFREIDAFLERWHGKDVLLFGFTFVIWQYLCQQLQSLQKKLQLSGVLVHGGGWKKLQATSVDNYTFKKTVTATTGINTVVNYYGMVEQTGSIFMECTEGHLHASNFSDIIIRNPLTLEEQPMGQPGLVQLLSLLPTSYPGHSILTEDMGVVHGVDDCPCGRKGVYFSILGRIKNAEIRGCSDAVSV